MVWPIYLNLKRLLEETELDRIDEAEGINSVVTVMKRLGAAYAKKNDTDMQPTFYHQTMTFLNPNMKRLGVISFVERMKLHTEIGVYIKEHIMEKTVEVSSSTVRNNESNLLEENFLENFESFDNGKKFLAQLLCHEMRKSF